MEELRADLTGVHVDHIIPVTAGGPDEEWNFQVLHGPCNRAKWSAITAEAIILAAEHGIELTAASRETSGSSLMSELPASARPDLRQFSF